MTPRRPADAGTRALTYDVTSEPAPIQVSQGSTPNKAPLRITVTNHHQSAVHVDSVRFTFPVGIGCADLSDNPGSAEPQADDVKKWRFELDVDTPGSALLTPKRSATVPPGGQLELALAHIEINAAVGTSKLTIEERIKDGPDPWIEEWPLAKVPAGFTTGDFRPETILVDSGTPTELTWRGDSRRPREPADRRRPPGLRGHRRPRGHDAEHPRPDVAPLRHRRTQGGHRRSAAGLSALAWVSIRWRRGC